MSFSDEFIPVYRLVLHTILNQSNASSSHEDRINLLRQYANEMQQYVPPNEPCLYELQAFLQNELQSITS